MKRFLSWLWMRGFIGNFLTGLFAILPLAITLWIMNWAASWLRSLTFNLKASLQVDSRYIAESVHTAVKTALLKTFSFEKRSFGQAVTQSEVYATIQKIEGVVAMDLDGLHFTSATVDAYPRLPQFMADWEVALNKPARLLTLNPQGITLTEMTI